MLVICSFYDDYYFSNEMRISNPNKLDYNSLLALKTAYESGNFSKGAKAMRVTKSAMFQRIKALETVVGGPLLNRGT